MAGKTRSYYADGNTAKGFWSFHKSNIEGMNQLFILQGTSGECKSTLIKNLALEFTNKGYDIELMHSSSDNSWVNGMIIPQLKFGIIDEIPHQTFEAFEPLSSGTIAKYFDLDITFNPSKLEAHKDEILNLNTKKQETLVSAYFSFNQALLIHDEWEKIYIENMSFSKATEITQELEKIFFADKTLSKNSVIRDRFLGAATPKGPIDFINNLTEDISKRYFIKGRPGTGKSTLLKKLAKNAQERGFDVEVYHCGFDPNSLDMLIFRELDLAIFDSTSPHEYFPVRSNDKIIDMYKEAVVPGTDEKYSLELQDIVQRYKNKILEGTNLLKEANTLNDQLENIYNNIVDFEKFEEIRKLINLEF